MKISYSLWRNGLLPNINDSLTERDILHGPGSQKALTFIFNRFCVKDMLFLQQELSQFHFEGIEKLTIADVENALCEFYKFIKAVNIMT